MPNVPVVHSFVSSPLRNRIQVELNAPAPEVWALMGNLYRFPEYSSGLEKVDASVDAGGACTEYICHFKPQEEGGESMTHREVIRWYESNTGWASQAEEPNAFGLTDALTLVTLEDKRSKTVVTWEQYYNAADLDMNKSVFDHALRDIAHNLITRFGGSKLESS